MKFKLKPPKIQRRPSDRQQAREFAARAEAGRVYYVVDELADGPKAGAMVVSEKRFTKKAFVGLMSGSVTPEQLWMEYGHVYTDRADIPLRRPDGRALPTTVEMAEEAEKLEEQMFSSPGWRESQNGRAVGTGFRSTW